MNRRSMLNRVLHTGMALSFAGTTSRARESRAALPEPSPRKLPRWRGFNLLEMFQVAGSRPFREEDFAWIQRHNFHSPERGCEARLRNEVRQPRLQFLQIRGRSGLFRLCCRRATQYQTERYQCQPGAIQRHKRL